VLVSLASVISIGGITSIYAVSVKSALPSRVTRISKSAVVFTLAAIFRIR